MIKFIGWANSLNDESEKRFCKKFINFKDFRKERIFGPGKKIILETISTFTAFYYYGTGFLREKRTVYINYLPF